jgi:hypothetical protein
MIKIHGCFRMLLIFAANSLSATAVDPTREDAVASSPPDARVKSFLMPPAEPKPANSARPASGFPAEPDGGPWKVPVVTPHLNPPSCWIP